MRRRLGRLPEAVMGGKRAIGGAEALQPPIEQREMHRLVGAYAEPVVDELRRKVRAETARHVEGEVDGSELDVGQGVKHRRSEEHTSELQSLMRISYAVFCLKTKTP